MSRALQFVEKFLERDAVGSCDVFQRTKARQIAAHAGSSSRYQDGDGVLRGLLKNLGHGEARRIALSGHRLHILSFSPCLIFALAQTNAIKDLRSDPLSFEALGDTHQFVRLGDRYLLAPGSHQVLTFPPGQHAADGVEGRSGDFGQVLP